MKRTISIFMAMVMLLSTMAIPTSAEGVFDGAIKMEQLEYYQVSLNANGNKYYKVTVPKDGTLLFRNGECEKSFASSNIITMLNTNAEDLGYYSMNSNQSYEFTAKAGTYYFRITADYNSFSLADLYYTFTPDKKATVAIKMALKKGAKVQLATTVENYKGGITWLSTKKDVAKIDSKGNVTALKKGTTVIRATLDDGTRDEFRITVS